MNREEKAKVIQSIKNDLKQSESMFIVNYSGLTVSQMRKLRGKLKDQGGKLKVAKVRLVKRAIDEVDSVEGLFDHLKNQIGMVFSLGESTSVAKVLCEFSKEHESLGIIAGKFDSQLLNKQEVIRLGSLPSKEVLYAQLCATMKSPFYRLIFVCRGQILKFLLILNKIKEKQG